jgi:hypothetical protein
MSCCVSPVGTSAAPATSVAPDQETVCLPGGPRLQSGYCPLACHTAWLTEAEWKALVPAEPRPGDVVPVPDAVQNASSATTWYHLVNGAFGLPGTVCNGRQIPCSSARRFSRSAGAEPLPRSARQGMGTDGLFVVRLDAKGKLQRSADCGCPFSAGRLHGALVGTFITPDYNAPIRGRIMFILHAARNETSWNV